MAVGAAVSRPLILALLGLSLSAAAGHADSEGTIVRGCATSSLVSSLAAASVPPAVIAEARRALERRIDIGHVRRFFVHYDTDETPRLLEASLVLAEGRGVTLHRLRGRLWFGDGESAEPPRLAKPIPDAPVSSPFGKRNDTVYGPIRNIGPLGAKPRVVKAHPLLTPTSSFHSGVDYSAPAGAPVLAAGDGVVRQVGKDRALGVAVTIEHDHGLATRYGHLAGAAAGIAEGVHVTQGQVIGAVGSTGLSSGPHLHYEILANGRVVNPIGHPKTRADRLDRQDTARLRALTEAPAECPED